MWFHFPPRHRADAAGKWVMEWLSCHQHRLLPSKLFFIPEDWKAITESGTWLWRLIKLVRESEIGDTSWHFTLVVLLEKSINGHQTSFLLHLSSGDAVGTPSKTFSWNLMQLYFCVLFSLYYVSNISISIVIKYM